VTSSLDGLQSASRTRLDALLAKQWSLPGEHPLARLSDASLGDYRLLVLLGPKNNVGSRYFQVLLADARGRLAKDALAIGLHNTGRYPAFNWVELTRYESMLTFDDETLDLVRDGFDLPLFKLLSELVPPGGHMMVEYDSPSQRATERVLTLGYPQAASPIGYLMFQVGCRSYRDWYISEGGREGPRKLQGFKPWNEEIAREKTGKLRQQLSEFLARPDVLQHKEWGDLARSNARRVLEALGT
jgi:hypothetical protein